MSTATAKSLYTPEDLLTMPDADRYELVDGRLVERHTGAWSSYIGGQLFVLMDHCCTKNSAGWVWPADCSYQCFRKSPAKVRRPDVSFIRLGRLPGERAPDGHIPIAPDLAVEVLSPNDLDYETDQKVDEYLTAGVLLVWVINPESRTVLIYRADGSISGLREHDELSGEDVFPQFRCRVADLFVSPAAHAPAAPPNP
jgi:Uma2 family endonuclease